MNANYIVHGIGRTGRYIRAEVRADSSGHAQRMVRSSNPDARGLACRALVSNAETVLEALASRPSQALRPVVQ